MIELRNFPMRNQLHELPPSDGKPDENKSYNCLPTSIAAGVQWYTGKRVPADDLKDAVYGQGHIGGGSAASYRAYIKARYGLTLAYTPLPSASQAIIDHIRSELRAGHPVIVTMHSHWSTPWPKDGGDGLHVGVAYAISETDAGELWIMNPWGGFRHAEPVSWWRDRLGNGVWPVIGPKAGGQEASTVQVPNGWKDDGATLTAPNGVAVVRGFRDHVLITGWEADNWPLAAEYGTASVEPGNPVIGPGSRQDFRYRSLGWTQTRNVYAIWTGQDILALSAEVADLKAKLAAAEAKAAQPAPIPQKYLDALAAVRALIEAEKEAA